MLRGALGGQGAAAWRASPAAQFLLQRGFHATGAFMRLCKFMRWQSQLDRATGG